MVDRHHPVERGGLVCGGQHGTLGRHGGPVRVLVHQPFEPTDRLGPRLPVHRGRHPRFQPAEGPVERVGLLGERVPAQGAAIRPASAVASRSRSASGKAVVACRSWIEPKARPTLMKVKSTLSTTFVPWVRNRATVL